MKTLIVEDNSTFRHAFLEALLSLFPAMNIEEAENGELALEKMQSFSPNLIFMDIRLGKENGLELTTKIKQYDADTTIIILTDYNLPEYREAAFQSGADDFVVKGTLNPPAIKALIKSIAKAKGLSLNNGIWKRK